MADSYSRGMPSTLRGWLSEVFFPALVSSQARQLALRLGDRATVDDPLFGRSEGAAIAERLDAAAAWLTARGATFERLAFVMGSDRDVTEGTLSLVDGAAPVRAPVAVVAVRRREREVEVRTYYSASRLPRPPAAPGLREPFADDESVAVPPSVAAHLDALARGDVDAVVASFEQGATVRGPDGETHLKLEGAGGPLRAYYERLLTDGGIEVASAARADDGVACALEYAIVRLGGRELRPRAPGLAVYERGQSGLLRAVRMYDDVTARR